jgi:pimeloyl-ACP methyl ester carboxylesterase
VAFDNPVTLERARSDKPICGDPCTRHAIVFVHGIFGGADTWVNQSTHTSFPKLISADPAFANFDVYIANYNTDLGFSGPGNHTRLTQVGKGLFLRLQESDRYKSIHLIGHSMGGNAIITAILFLKFTRPDAHQVLNRYRSIILLGTPIEGSDLAKVGWLVSNDNKLIALKPVVENELPVLVELGLNAIDEKRYVLGFPALPIAAGFEQKEYLGKIIVTEASATAIGSIKQGFQKNHVDLAKPGDRTDSVYSWVAHQVRDGLNRYPNLN